MSGRRILPTLSLRTWLVSSHVFVLLLPVVIGIGTGALAEELQWQTREDLDHQASLIAIMVDAQLDEQPGASISLVAPRLNPYMEQVRNETLVSVRVLDADGVVVATSGEQLGDDLSGRPEVAEARTRGIGEAIRPREPTSSPPWDPEQRRANVRLFVARPILHDDRLVGYVLLSRTPREEAQALYQRVSGWWVLATLGLTVGTALLVGWAGARSLRELSSISWRVADGEPLPDAVRAEQSHVAEVADTAVAVRVMAEKLRRRLSYITEFAGNVAHEFNTPIATLNGTVELLREDVEMPATQRATFLLNAQAEIQRLDRLVAGLLELARAEDAGDLAAVALIDPIRRGVENRPGVTIGEGFGTVRGNAVQIEAIVRNLVENAFRHGKATRVQITPIDSGFAVVDDGVGISPNNLPRVFDRFFTTDRAGGGTGIGLALVRAIARAHGGEVIVRSEPGRTAFDVRLGSARQ